MAQRRMFSPQIVESDEFLGMPVSSQSLYFHLGMNADDDGFIQPRIVMRTIGAAEDDLKMLLARRFLLPFESGVVVIKHWLIHNLIQKDRYHATRFQEEKSMLFIKENKSYTDNPDSVNKMLPEVRLGKVREVTSLRSDSSLKVEEVHEEDARAKKPRDPNLEKAARYWLTKCEEEVGQAPTGGLAKVQAVIKRANQSISFSQIKQMMDDWFENQTLPPQEMIQITRCLSPLQVDTYLAENI